MKTINGNTKIGNEVGRLGESIASNFLLRKGFKIIERNFVKKWGEIDIIAKNIGEFHFIEVKTTSGDLSNKSVTREKNDKYRAEDNIHPWKLQRLKRVISSYLIENSISYETSWHFDVVTVVLDKNNKKAKVFLMDNVIL